MTSREERETPDFSGYGLHSSGGRFDFNTYEIDARFVENPLFVAHEQEHNGFVRGTVFGYVQRTAELLHRAATAGEVARDFARVKWALWQASSRTHERGATYCSIKAQPSERHAEIVAALPEPYRRFYDEVAAIADKVFASSFTQYAFGKAITNHALNAPLQELLVDLVSSAQLREVELTAEYAPDARWGLLVDALAGFGPASLAKRVSALTEDRCGSAGLELPGAVDDEETWLSLTLEQATALDACLYPALREAVAEVCVEVAAVAPEDFDSAQQAAAAALGRLAGTTVEAARAPRSARAEADLRAKIRNEVTLDAGRVVQLEPGELIRHWSSGTGPRFAIRMPSGDVEDRAEWIVALTADDVTALARASDADFQRVLAMRARLASIGSPVPELPTLARIAAPEDLPDAYNALAPFFGVELDDGFLDLGSGDLHWYMGGNLREWWEELRGFGRIRVLPTVPRPAWDALADRGPIHSVDDARRLRDDVEALRLDDAVFSDLPSGRSLLICQAEGLLGRFIRALPSLAMSSLSELIGDDFDVVPVEEREAISASAWRLFALAERVWPSV